MIEQSPDSADGSALPAAVLARCRAYFWRRPAAILPVLQNCPPCGPVKSCLSAKPAAHTHRHINHAPFAFGPQISATLYKNVTENNGFPHGLRPYSKLKLKEAARLRAKSGAFSLALKPTTRTMCIIFILLLLTGLSLPVGKPAASVVVAAFPARHGTETTDRLIVRMRPGRLRTQAVHAHLSRLAGLRLTPFRLMGDQS